MNCLKFTKGVYVLGGFSEGSNSESNIGNENSARSFSDRSFFSPPSRRGRPHLRVMDVRTEMLAFFPGFRGPDRIFCPRTSTGICAWTSAGYPAPKLTLWAAFSFLKISSIAFSCLGNRAISGVRDGHRNRKSQTSLRFWCAKELSEITKGVYFLGGLVKAQIRNQIPSTAK